MSVPARYGPTDMLGDYRLEPPDEPEVDWERGELVEKAKECHRKMESVGIELADADLLTSEEDSLWEHSLEVFYDLLIAAEKRLAEKERCA